MRAIGRQYNVDAASVVAWAKTGCPRLPNGKFNPEAVATWLRERQEKKATSGDLKAEKLQQDILKAKRDVQLRDIEIAEKLGKVHNRHECAKSLTEIRAAESRILHNIGTALRAQFPEIDSKIIEALNKIVDEVVVRLGE